MNFLSKFIIYPQLISDDIPELGLISVEILPITTLLAVVERDMSHPDSRKQNRSLHKCAQNVQITRTTNNMVNRYNISLNYKLESLQNDSWVQKKYYPHQKTFQWFHQACNIPTEVSPPA
jgi:hypothetical protein